MTTTNERRYPYLVNGQEAFTLNPRPLSNQLLKDAGFEPADDYTLIQRTARGTRIVAPDEVADLTQGAKEFFAFDSGVLYTLTVDGVSIYWGAASIDVTRIRQLADVPDDVDLIQKRPDDNVEILPFDGKLGLKGPGIEHLKTRKRQQEPQTYIFYVDGIEYRTEHPSLTGAQIMAMIPEWNPANTLVLESEDDANPDAPVRDIDIVKFKGRKKPAHFIVVPPATFGC
ncbi:MAG: hypothetical protein AABY95_03650 [Pseudomonadota bacterium]